MFFTYIRKNEIPVIWTLHDNWAFTGRCAQFRCEEWREGCGNCPHLDFFPGSLFLDNTANVWKKREKLYNSIHTMTIVTPSKWLSDLVRISLFKENHPIKVINNGINLNIFKPTDSDFRKEHGLIDKKMILAVAYFWDAGKGLYVFMELAKRLPADYQIVMVGTNDETDKVLPGNIISIHKTYNQEELVKIYSCADLFVNPTTDENFPTVNMEALACGLPVLTYDTGGCAEMKAAAHQSLREISTQWRKRSSGSARLNHTPDKPASKELQNSIWMTNLQNMSISTTKRSKRNKLSGHFFGGPYFKHKTLS